MKQPLFAPDAAAVASHFAVFADHAVTGNDNGYAAYSVGIGEANNRKTDKYFLWNMMFRQPGKMGSREGIASNWALFLDNVRENGALPTLYPADFKLPMVAPEDIGVFAAELMTNDNIGLHFIEGPARYSANDVADAFGVALQQEVKVASVPEKDWVTSLQHNGFSEEAAESMANVTRIVLAGRYEVSYPEHGKTTLTEYISRVVKR